MTATEELRRLLDKRGVEYSREGCETFFKNIHIWAINNKKLCISISGLTPEQAIEATLGRGTCRNISDPPEGFYCSSCGWGDFAEPSHLLTTAKFTDNDGGPNYCPNCGKAVKR